MTPEWRKSPEYKARQAAYHRAWVERNRERNRTYKRNWKRRHDQALYDEREENRAMWTKAWASLHDLSCRYPEKRCRCHPALLVMR